MEHPNCHVCDDLKFIVSERDDGRLAVYPCYVTGVLPS